jgi:hypothetical protein
MAQISEIKSAKLRILGCLKTRSVEVAGGVTLWSEQECTSWKADAEELSHDLALLGVAHYVTRTCIIQAPWRTPQTEVRACRWEKIWVLGDNFTRLADVLPGLTKLEIPQPDNEPETQLVVDRHNYAFIAVDGEELIWIVGPDAIRGSQEFWMTS